MTKTTNLTLKASSYEVPAWTVDGMDVFAVASSAARAIEAIRAGAGPHFLEDKTYRFRAHSMFDPERYRDKDEVARWKEHDPIDAAVRRLGLAEDALAALEAEVAEAVDDAVAFAEESPLEEVADLLRFVYSPDSTAADSPMGVTGGRR